MEVENRAVEQIKVFRDFAKFYFSVRSNLTYLNVVACGAFTYFLATPLLGFEPNSSKFVDTRAFLQHNYWLYVAGCIAYFGFAAFATALCNLMSNSFYSYMEMSMKAEKDIGISYEEYNKKSWAVTYEFSNETAKTQVLGPAFQGNVWNTFNGALAIYGMYTLTIITSIQHPSPLAYWVLGFISLAFFVSLFLVFFFSFAEISLRWGIWIIIAALLYAPVANNEIMQDASKWPMILSAISSIVGALIFSYLWKRADVRNETPQPQSA